MRARHYRRARIDYPDGVLAVYDNGGRAIDRYTVVYTPHEEILQVAGVTPIPYPTFPYVGMSGSPFHPQGFCQHGETIGIRPTGGWGSDIGRVIAFEGLPADCRRVVERDLEEEA